jgi:hypothetical protein
MGAHIWLVNAWLILDPYQTDRITSWRRERRSSGGIHRLIQTDPLTGVMTGPGIVASTG